MILLWILLLPLLGGLIAWRTSSHGSLARIAMVLALAVDAVLLVWWWGRHAGMTSGTGGTEWLAQFSVPWMPTIGVHFALAMDGLALLMALLSCVVGLAVVLTANLRRTRSGLFALLIMALISATLGVFLAADLILFFVCFEVMLLPAYGLIALWGAGNARRTAIRFFLFTQAGGLLMLLAILGLHASHFNATGVRTFAYVELVNTPLDSPVAILFLLGFFLAFAIKLPVVPFHAWQPDTYTSAPVEASILFSAIMAKTAGYGLLRFAVPMFPQAAETLAPWAMALGVVSILYTSWLAYGQTDLKRIIAYSSAGHLGYIVLGAFALNDIGMRGAVMQMVCHGISVTGLFLLADAIERRTGTRDVERLGGLWKTAPRMGALTLVFALATLGLPGLGNFVGEFLVLAGAFQTYPIIAAAAVPAVVLAAAYSLRIVQRVFFGNTPPELAAVQTDSEKPAASNVTTIPVCAVLASILLCIGFFPQPVLDAARGLDVRSEAIVISTETPPAAESTSESVR